MSLSQIEYGFIRNMSQSLVVSDLAEWNVCCVVEGVYTAIYYLGIFRSDSIYDLLCHLLGTTTMPE